MTFSIRIHGQKFFKTHFQFPNHEPYRNSKNYQQRPVQVDSVEINVTYRAD